MSQHCPNFNADDIALIAGLIADQSEGSNRWELLEKLIQRHVAFDSIQCLTGFRSIPLEETYASSRNRDLSHYLDSYWNGGYLLDPLIGKLEEGPKNNGLWHLKEYCPDDFLQSDYYANCYSALNFDDDCTYIYSDEDGFMVGLSLGRSNALPQYTAAELECLHHFTPIVIACQQNHIRQAARRYQLPELASNADRHTEALIKRIEHSFNNFGRSLLTAREQELALLLLRGHSNRSAADKMGVSTETIKMHRKNLHTKLDISSHAELFSLFIQALPYQQGEQQDPLDRFFNSK